MTTPDEFDFYTWPLFEPEIVYPPEPAGHDAAYRDLFVTTQRLPYCQTAVPGQVQTRESIQQYRETLALLGVTILEDDPARNIPITLPGTTFNRFETLAVLLPEDHVMIPGRSDFTYQIRHQSGHELLTAFVMKRNSYNYGYPIFDVRFDALQYEMVKVI